VRAETGYERRNRDTRAEGAGKPETSTITD
jgi:hypothetical protein